MQKRHPVDFAPPRIGLTATSILESRRFAIGLLGLLAPLAFLAGCNATDRSELPPWDAGGKDAKPITPAGNQQPAAPVLTLTDQRLQWPVTVPRGTGPIRYIEVVIDGIDNPRLIPLRFRVYSPDRAGGERLLGSFASYPGNQPGRYLIQVPPQFQLGEVIVLALAPAADFSADDTVRVRIGSVKFLPANAG
jgi:hypothetical protein